MSADPTQLKKPKTYEEQLAILRTRGLIVNNEERATEILKRLNYYRLAAYTLTFKKGELFPNGNDVRDIIEALYGKTGSL